MKRILSIAILVLFATVAFTGQSWAMFFRHHHSGDGQGNDNGPSGHDSQDWTENNWTSGNNDSHDNQSNQTTTWNDPDSNTNDSNGFPTAPVPEPMTLSLLGTGMAAVLLKRKLNP